MNVSKKNRANRYWRNLIDDEGFWVSGSEYGSRMNGLVRYEVADAPELLRVADLTLYPPGICLQLGLGWRSFGSGARLDQD